jgi:hypothetical protein
MSESRLVMLHSEEEFASGNTKFVFFFKLHKKVLIFI